MANQNSFREIGDKCNVSQSTAYDIIVQLLGHMSVVTSDHIKWPDQLDKETRAGVFRCLI